MQQQSIEAIFTDLQNQIMAIFGSKDD